MARVTVEDCVLKIPNRFELVSIAAQRARHISAGAPLLVERDRDKNPVVSLREIADDKVDLAELTEDIIQSQQRQSEPDSGEDDMAESLMQPGPGRQAEEPADDDDFDLESLAAELRAQAGEFKTRDEE